MSRKHKNHRATESEPKTSGPLPVTLSTNAVTAESPKIVSPTPASARSASPKSTVPGSASPGPGDDPQGMSWQLIFLVIVMGLGILGLVAKSLNLF